MTFTAKYLTLYERLVANSAEPDNAQGCWEWTGRGDGKHASRTSYPRVNLRINGKHRTLKPHRLMVEIMLGLDPGTLPADVEPDHLCQNYRCINPDHLEPVTQAVNLARMVAKRLGSPHRPGQAILLAPRPLPDPPF